MPRKIRAQSPNKGCPEKSGLTVPTRDAQKNQDSKSQQGMPRKIRVRSPNKGCPILSPIELGP